MSLHHTPEKQPQMHSLHGRFIYPRLSAGLRLFSTRRVALLTNFDGLATGLPVLTRAAAHLAEKATMIVAVNGEEDMKRASEAISKAESPESIDRFILALAGRNNGEAALSAESVCGLAESVHRQFSFTHWLSLHDSFGKDVLPRLAAKLDATAIADVAGIEEGAKAVRYRRSVYAGNAVAELEADEGTAIVHCVTVRATAFPRPKTNDTAASSASGTESGSKPAIEKHEASPMASLRSRVLIGHAARDSQSARPDLSAAKIVVSGGRALKDAATFSRLLDPLAETLGAAVGASRAAVDAGFCANELQVGQTGKIVAPELYIAVGISGAIQHLAGIQDSRVIVAINRDPDCPIFQVADYGLVGDLFQILPELTAKLQALRQK
jgi:electron transfer flavoprotein alpha subunit